MKNQNKWNYKVKRQPKKPERKTEIQIKSKQNTKRKFLIHENRAFHFASGGQYSKPNIS